MTTNPSAPNINVPIRIEPTDEYKIQEITYDGQEKYIPPLSMSENLTQLIQKIDFNQPIDELKEELEQTCGDEGDDTSQKSHPPISSFTSWPFDSMRTKLRIALTEICVLNDVLSIAKEKKYMVFDTINVRQSELSPIEGLMAKKRALQAASQILIDGASTLKFPNSSNKPGAGLLSSEFWGPNESASSSQSNPDETLNFYDELREMRQSWRLKRVGGSIIGDLSYFRPVGYRFTASSRFEVIKTSPTTRGPQKQALMVKVPSDLEGRAYIQVSIIKSNDISLVDLSTSAHGRLYGPAHDGTWQEKLEAAQNVLFCKELFRHLANQAVQHQFVIPTTVAGNQIILALFTDIKLYITLVHRTPDTKGSKEMSEGMKKLQLRHKSVFEHSLHQMLRDFYSNAFRRMQERDIPKKAGPYAMDKQTLTEVTRQELSLYKIVSQAQHLIMRQQTMEVIDTYATQIRDPLIISHWFCLNSPTTSIVRVDIVSKSNEILGRSHMLIYVGTRELRVITRDCKNLVLGYEPDELRYLLVWQSCLHQFIASDKLSKLLGWYTLVLNYSVNVTRQDVSSSAFSLVICSSNCSQLISVKSGPQFGLTVEVAQFKEPSNVSGALANGFHNSSPSSQQNRILQEQNYRTNQPEGSIESILNLGLNGNSFEKPLNKLQDLIENFREVDWDKMQGRDFLTKLELLMAALTDLK